MIRVLAADAAAALRALGRATRIDSTRLGFAGGSQAGWIIPAAAARAPARFAVILSGPLVSVGEEVYYSSVFERSDLPLNKVDSVLSQFTGTRGYDPVPDIRRATAGIYWMYGARDRSIPAVRSAAIATALLNELGRSDWRVDLQPAANHSLIDPEGRSVAFLPPFNSWLREQLR
jgi:dienelactone hydrolase